MFCFHVLSFIGKSAKETKHSAPIKINPALKFISEINPISGCNNIENIAVTIEINERIEARFLERISLLINLDKIGFLADEDILIIK